MVVDNMTWKGFFFFIQVHELWGGGYWLLTPWGVTGHNNPGSSLIKTWMVLQQFGQIYAISAQEEKRLDVRKDVEVSFFFFIIKTLEYIRLLLGVSFLPRDDIVGVWTVTFTGRNPR